VTLSPIDHRCSCRTSKRQGQRFDDVSDQQTGTMYARCLWCGLHHPTSRAGYIDWDVGVMMDSQYAVGSAWTLSENTAYFAALPSLRSRNT